MYQTSALLFLYNETPLHPGTGTGIGDVDQPIQRETYTQFPVIHDSGVKGASRHDMAEDWNIREIERRIKELESEAGRSDEQQQELQEKKEKIASFEAVFGPDVGSGREHEHGGALGFSDARILLFPVRSLQGLFAWVTCPLALDRLRRDLSKVVPETAPSAKEPSSSVPALPEALASLDALLQRPLPSVETAWASDDCSARIPSDGHDEIVLEDFTFTCSDGDRSPHVDVVGRWLASRALPQADAFAHMRHRMPSSLVVVADEAFRDFTRFSTEVVTRIRIGETGTVVTGALWNEEHLPPDCLLYSLTPAMRSQKKTLDMGAGKVLETFADHLEDHSLIQFGGGKSLSRGLTQATLQTPQTLHAGAASDTEAPSSETPRSPSANA